jgi:hypothetical protein
MAPEVPKGKTAAFLYVVRCERGHEWFTYGDSEGHYGPALCRYCGNGKVGASVSKTLTAEEAASLKRFHVVLKATFTPTSAMDDTTEEDIDAQDIRETARKWEFIVGELVVQQFPKTLVVGQPVLEP